MEGTFLLVWALSPQMEHAQQNWHDCACKHEPLLKSLQRNRRCVCVLVVAEVDEQWGLKGCVNKWLTPSRYKR